MTPQIEQQDGTRVDHQGRYNTRHYLGQLVGAGRDEPDYEDPLALVYAQQNGLFGILQTDQLAYEKHQTYIEYTGGGPSAVSKVEKS